MAFSISNRFSGKVRNAFRSLRQSKEEKHSATLVINQPNTINEAFAYAALSSSKNEIRLVTISPGASLEAPVACQLSHASLDESPRYEALSYTWGSPVDPIAITLNDQPFHVTRSLHEALCHLRPKNASRTLWIDAICINQLSIPERNAQVRIMRTIYRQSQQTLIWLGPAFKNSDLMMDFIGWEDERLLNPTLDGGDDDWAAARYYRAMQEPRLLHIWEALYELSQRPYWKRMWIVQEIAFGTAPQVCVGTRSASFWDALMRVLSSLSAELEMELPGRPINHPWVELLAENKALAIGRERKDINIPKGPSWLAAALLRYRGSLATDPRDKVIALLGFLDESSVAYDQLITVDYSRPVRDLYLDIFKFCASEPRLARTHSESHTGSNPTFTLNYTMTWDRATVLAAQAEGRTLDDDEVHFGYETEEAVSRARGPLNILTAAGIRDKGTDNFPSWLPHWGRDSSTLSIDDLSGNRYTVSGETPPVYVLSEENKILHASGVLLHKITHVGDKIQNSYPNPVELVRSVASWYRLAEKHPSASNPFERSYFWRALVFDSYLNRYFSEAPQQWYDMDLDSLIQTAEDSMVPGRGRIDLSVLANELLLMLQKTTRGRRFALTEEGLYTMVPEEAKTGDVVVVLFGCDIPLLLRRVHLGRHWVMVGECFCYGIMDGEVIDGLKEAGLLSITGQDFEIH
ncbi:hypothetical protein H2201_002138 [Coniosporium apollinis]|uniref:Heterokaryon incompatibility domain-containing protein n=1 Tax=Coniosporium apollinis TaxID=61459 RepID=A0ABQ9P023_9PEZI|nr:hypothetical protein H2201_002138 [Coniosporium apollinis]